MGNTGKGGKQHRPSRLRHGALVYWSGFMNLPAAAVHAFSERDNGPLAADHGITRQ